MKIVDMKTETLIPIIGQRLQGIYNAYPLGDGEHPFDLFRRLFIAIDDRAFINEFHLALRDLLWKVLDAREKMRTNPDDEVKPEADDKYIAKLLLLVEFFYKVYNGQGGLMNGIHSVVEERLNYICTEKTGFKMPKFYPERPLLEKYHDLVVKILVLQDTLTKFKRETTIPV